VLIILYHIFTYFCTLFEDLSAGNVLKFQTVDIATLCQNFAEVKWRKKRGKQVFFFKLKLSKVQNCLNESKGQMKSFAF
jgi:hypothetical protein